MERQETPWLERMARFGYAARGFVYVVVGWLAVLAALGSGRGQTGGGQDALGTFLGKPYGDALLVAVALGLACFALWRVIEALSDADRRGRSWKGLARRGGHLVSGLVYAGFALSVLGLVLGRGSRRGGGDATAQDWTAWLLAQPFGPWLVGAVALAILGTGFAYAWRAWQGDVTDRLRLPPAARNWVVPLGRAGFAARGLVFVLIGGFLLIAALRANSAEAQGLGGALDALRAQLYGWVLLGITAAGLFAFGVFGLVQAWYRRIDAPELDALAAKVPGGAAMGRQR